MQGRDLGGENAGVTRQRLGRAGRLHRPGKGKQAREEGWGWGSQAGGGGLLLETEELGA